MFIPKTLYEGLPYLYIGASVTVYLLVDSPLVYLSAVLLYSAGALIWVTRSAYRRKNRKDRIENRRNHVRFPEQLYEYLPFIYLAAGLVIATHIPGLLGSIPGGLLCLSGVLVWLIRAIYRSHSDLVADA